jgi:fluoride exporter
MTPTNSGAITVKLRTKELAHGSSRSRIFPCFYWRRIGSMLRHAVDQTSAATLGVNFPFGTLFVNITGSLAIGLLAGWFAFRGDGGSLLRLFLATGILGGFTTFSAFSLDAALLWQRGETVGAALYVVGSIGMSVIGVFIGLAAMRALVS